jgi:hypothetical protein
LARIIPFLSDYAKREINEANFTCVAFHYDIIGALYHFNPKNDEMNAYGRIFGSKFVDIPKTKEKYTQSGGKRKRWIVWDEIFTRLKSKNGKTTPVPQKLTIKEFRKEIQADSVSAMICFDLDGLYGINDRGPKEKAVNERVRKSQQVLECVHHPIFVGIARSQTPRTYVPPEIVNEVQDQAMNLIEMTYG